MVYATALLLAVALCVQKPEAFREFSCPGAVERVEFMGHGQDAGIVAAGQGFACVVRELLADPTELHVMGRPVLSSNARFVVGLLRGDWSRMATARLLRADGSTVYQVELESRRRGKKRRWALPIQQLEAVIGATGAIVVSLGYHDPYERRWRHWLSFYDEAGGKLRVIADHYGHPGPKLGIGAEHVAVVGTASAGASGPPRAVVELYSVNGECVWSRDQARRAVGAVAMSPDGRRIAVRLGAVHGAMSGAGKAEQAPALVLYDAAGQVTASYPSAARLLRFAHDGSLLVAADGGALSLVGTAEPTILWQQSLPTTGRDAYVLGVDVNPAFVAAATISFLSNADGTQTAVRETHLLQVNGDVIWRAELARKPRGLTREKTGVRLSPDGRLLVAWHGARLIVYSID